MATSLQMTPRKIAILEGIEEDRRRLGYSPTLKEVGDWLGINKVSVLGHVEGLIEM